MLNHEPKSENSTATSVTLTLTSFSAQPRAEERKRGWADDDRATVAHVSVLNHEPKSENAR